MKCLEREKVFEYVGHMLGPQEAEAVRAHIEECEACRALAADYERLGNVLDEWKAPQLSPWFDARLRARLAADKEGGLWGVWGFLEWRRWLLPALVVSLIVLAIVVVLRSPREPQPVARQDRPGVVQPPLPAPEKRQPDEVARAEKPVVKPGPAMAPGEEEGVAFDEDLLGAQDYDLLANFEVLSELPGGGTEIVN